MKKRVLDEKEMVQLVSSMVKAQGIFLKDTIENAIKIIEEVEKQVKELYND